MAGLKEFLPTKVPNDNVSLSSDLDSEITNLDFIYSLRIQKERHKNLNQDLYNEFVKKFSVTLEKLTKFKKLIPVLHPGPVNVGVELDQELLDSPCYKGYLQVRNSIYMRMAIITAMLQNNDKIVGKFHESIQQD